MCTRPLGRPQRDTRGSIEAHAELRLQVLQGSYRSNSCDIKNGSWKLEIMRLQVGSKNEGPRGVLLSHDLVLGQLQDYHDLVPG